MPFALKAQSPFLPPTSYLTTQSPLPYPQSLQFFSQQFDSLAQRQQYGTESNYDEDKVRRTLAKIRASRLQRFSNGDNHELEVVTSSAFSSLPIIYQVGTSPGQRVCRISTENENNNIEQTRADRFPALTSGFSRLGADCTQYIRNDGTYGTLGQAIVSSIRDRGDDSIFYNNEINGQAHACPN